MSAEGFACLYLPSVAPQSATPPTVVSADNNVLGGIGSGTYFNLSKIIVVNKCYNSVKINILQAIDYFLRKLDWHIVHGYVLINLAILEQMHIVYGY